MITLRKSKERGHLNHGWLDTYHSFSFGNYYDPDHMGFRTLRVINEDWVSPGQGFGTHPHRDMEIITYVLEGALEHKDSLGTGSVIRPGEVQRMSAGKGIEHSEFNASTVEKVHLLQIWILPRAKGLAPSYEQKNFSLEEQAGKLVLLGSPNGAQGSVSIQQDVQLYGAILSQGQVIEYAIKPSRAVWIQIARGKLTLGSHALEAGDGVAIENETSLSLSAIERAELLLFDMA